MGETIRVSYLVLGAYGAFVVVASLLVGLLPPLVNRPTCKDEIAIDLPKELYESKLGRHQRDATVPELNIYERMEAFSEKYPNKLEEIFKRRNVVKKAVDAPICKELIQPEAGVNYPWYFPRLPDNIAPINYDLELFVPKWGLNIYDGFINMKLEVKAPTEYVLIHASLELPFIQEFVDKNNKSVDVECIGEFQYFKNDYYIVKTAKPLQPSDGPFNIKFLFIAILPEFDSGIFEFKFKTPEGDDT